MRQVNVTEVVPSGQVWNFHHITDTHLGSKNCDEAFLRAYVQAIKDDPDARWGMGGDVGDLITPKDKRFLGSELSERYRQKVGRIPDAVIEHACEVFEPIKDKCWYWGIGNHESSIAAYYDRGIGAEIASRLGVGERYIGYKGFVCVRAQYVKGRTLGPLIIDFHHGWQAGRLYGAFHVYAERLLGESPAHLFVRGHSHKRQGQVFTWHRPGTEYPYQETRAVVVGGCFVRSNEYMKGGVAEHLSDTLDDNYATRKGYRPQDPLGPPVIEIAVNVGRSIGEAAYDLKMHL